MRNRLSPTRLRKRSPLLNIEGLEDRLTPAATLVSINLAGTDAAEPVFNASRLNESARTAGSSCSRRGRRTSPPTRTPTATTTSSSATPS